MRRWFVFFLCAVLALSGCGAQGEETPGYTLYFRERDLRDAAGGGALRTETVYLPEDAVTAESRAAALLEALLAGPGDEALCSTIPAGTTLQSVTLSGSRATVDFSASYGSLSGVALTLADQAVTLTLTQLPDILSVQITVRGRPLDYRAKQIMTGRDVLLAPEGDVVSSVDVTLYFPDGSGTLTAEPRILELYEGDTQVGAVARAVENGPAADGLSAAFPEGFRPQSVWLEEDTCYVNLSSALLDNLDVPLGSALEALARSLCSLETVSETRFLVDGEYANTYGDVPVSEPYL